MGVFSSELKKAMIEKGIRLSDIPGLTRGRIQISTAQSYLKGHIPKQPAVIDVLADMAGLSRQHLRICALKDKMEEEMQKLEVQRPAFLKSLRLAQASLHQLPVIGMEQLSGFLSSSGYPEGEPVLEIPVAPGVYDDYSYGILIADNFMYPRVMPGEIAVMSPRVEGPESDYALIGTRHHELHFGRTIMHQHYYVVETRYPYTITHIRRADISFFHRNVGVIRRK